MIADRLKPGTYSPAVATGEDAERISRGDTRYPSCLVAPACRSTLVNVKKRKATSNARVSRGDVVVREVAVYRHAGRLRK